MMNEAKKLHEILLCTTDAAVWAREFCKINPTADEGAMISWFANAIETAKSITKDETKLIDQALANAEALKLDPANSTTPHCIEEYNSGLTNAISAIRESLQLTENKQ